MPTALAATAVPRQEIPPMADPADLQRHLDAIEAEYFALVDMMHEHCGATGSTPRCEDITCAERGRIAGLLHASAHCLRGAVNALDALDATDPF